MKLYHNFAQSKLLFTKGPGLAKRSPCNNFKKGAYINAKNKNGETPLHYSVSFGSYSSYNIVEYLIQENADVNTKDENGNTPLHFAAIMGKFGTARVLLKHKADVNAKNNRGMTALHYATDFNHRDLVELLLAHGASL